MDASLEPQKVYQFKVSMKYIKPQIWRRIQVPEDFTFAQLHIAIQCAMGWESAWSTYHLHQFEMKDPLTGEDHLIKPILADSDYLLFDFVHLVDQEKVKVSDYFKNLKDYADYEYDLGQGWRHVIMLEKILPLDAGVALFPICSGGRRAAPPEDDNEPEGYDPEKFDCKEVVFKPPEWWKVKNAAKKHKYGYF